MTRPILRLPTLPHRSDPGTPDSGGSGPLSDHPPRTLHRPRPLRNRTQRLLATRAVRDAIVSLAGVVGRPVRNQGGAEIGKLVDVVCRWDDNETYPPVTGLVVRVGRSVSFVDAAAIEAIVHTEVRLHSARVDLRAFEPRPGEVLLAKQVLDYQLVDVDGVKVIRRLGPLPGPGVRRLPAGGGGRLGPEPAAASGTGPVAHAGHARPGDRLGGHPAVRRDPPGAAPEVRLRTTNAGLERLRPGELADLLEDLMRPERQELLDSLSPQEAADALEEMDPEELASLLREAEPVQAANAVGQHGARRGGGRPAGPEHRRTRRGAGGDAPGQGHPADPPPDLPGGRGRGLHDHRLRGGPPHRDGGRGGRPSRRRMPSAPRSSTPWPWSTRTGPSCGICRCSS